MFDGADVFFFVILGICVGGAAGMLGSRGLVGASGQSVMWNDDATVVECKTADRPLASATVSGKAARVTCVAIPTGDGGAQ